MVKQMSMIGPKLRFLRDQEFEDEAALLLAEYGNLHGQVTVPPIPIEEIVEVYLKLRLTFDDMQKLFGVDDVHGALWINDRRVGIDKRLEPTENPAMLGRYRFTLAHEAGHWRLHRHLFQRKANQLTLLPDNVARPEYICRSSDSEPIEYQANRFASCLLMPAEMVKRTWHEWRGSLEPIYAQELRTKDDCHSDKQLKEHSVRPLADIFEVSAEAMRIRAEALGLLQQNRTMTLFDL